jgi:hypothetical protein
LDVDGVLDELTQGQLLEWSAYYAAEPWGQDRADLRAAIIACTQFNMFRARGTPAKRPRDFMAVPPKRADTTMQHRAALMAALRPLARRKNAGPD